MPKPVSDDVMQRVSDAIDALTHDPTLPRTKRQVEQLAKLSHATVARAFVQDAAAAQTTVNKYRLTERFERLTEHGGRKSAEALKSDETTQALRAKNAEIADLKGEVAAYAQALYAFYLNNSTPPSEPGQVIPLGTNRPRKRNQ